MNVKILVLYNNSCPSFEEAMVRIKEVIQENNFSTELTTKLLTSDEEAEKWKFIGSPTILINDKDIDPVDSNVFRLDNCRVYIKEDGNISPIPSKAIIKNALLNN
ncbi:MAG: hypothetical protein CL506_01425 [Actinobacteria bacterium]|nr:hypothetical protein [Dehalococcoidia bacterium]MBO83008.1 hypothetical protein [Actinomycetota bacterium]|tara:strand:+ start:335 stop:649 length:315 start_codon:yes stop_codon:yes gene_type:complete